jgi:hypothetical protein
MCQWLKRYFDLNYNGEEYDAVGRRKGQDLYYILGGSKVGSAQPGKSNVAPKSYVAPKQVASSGAKSSIGA